ATYQVTGPAGSQFLASGLSTGQRVQYTLSGKQVFGTLTDVTDTTFTLQPDNATDVPTTATPITVLSGRETLRVRKEGVFEDFGPGEDATTNNYIADVTTLVRISNLDGSPINFGAGDDRVTVDSLLKIPVRFNGGRGNDVLVGAGGD